MTRASGEFQSLTAVVSGSRLLPTPRATRGGSATETTRLLPTPTTEPATGNGHARNLGREAKLLPTPRSQNGEARNSNLWIRPADEPQNLENALAHVVNDGKWADYAPAIARHEATFGRAAPSPTDDKGRLSPRFVEWMMGLPLGHVTDVAGLSRSAQLRILGNGIVPRQAAHAWRSLLGEVP